MVGSPRSNGGINDSLRPVSNPDAFTPPGGPASFPRRRRWRRAADERSRRHPDSRRPSKRRCRSGYSEIERSQNQRLGAQDGEFRRDSAPLPAGFAPAQGSPRGAAKGRWRRWPSRRSSPRPFRSRRSPGSVPGRGVFERKRPRRPRFAMADGEPGRGPASPGGPGSVPASVPGRHAPTKDRAVLPGSPDHSKGAAVVGIPRSNGRRINDLERRVSNSGAVPLRPAARRHPGAGFTSGSGEGTLVPLAIPTIFPATLPVASLSGKRGGSWGVRVEPPRRPRFAMADGEPGRCSASPGGPAPSPRRCRGSGRGRKNRAVLPVRLITRRALP